MNCKVRVRKYVLIASPSKWKEKGQRVVVQSPMLEIGNASSVPVRRFNGTKENMICFMPREDIEKDSSNAYKKAMVDTSPKDIDAHGIALRDNDNDNGFKYRYGDPFWIYLEAEWSQYENEVTVINLRNHSVGWIPISHVCWFPKMSGPGSELWTLGGGTRIQKLEGQNKLWTWAISQDLSGIQVTTKKVSIPEKGTNTAERRWISSSEGQVLFTQILNNKSGINILSDCVLPEQPLSKRLSGVWCSPPPSSPGISESDVDVSSPSYGSGSAAMLNISLRAPVFSAAGSNSLAPTFHPQRVVSPENPRKYRRVSRNEDISPSTSSKGNSAGYSLGSLPAPAKRALPYVPYSFDLSRGLDGDTEAALSLVALSDEAYMKVKILSRRLEDAARAGKNEHAFSAADCDVMSDPTQIRAAWDATEIKPTIANLCHRNDDNCKYSKLSTQKHYHPDPEKCRLGEILPENDHEHCISSRHPFPGTAGGCLFEISGKDHNCCYWDENDRKDWPEITALDEYDDRKQKECLQWHAKLEDRSCDVMGPYPTKRMAYDPYILTEEGASVLNASNCHLTMLSCQRNLV